MSYFQMRCMVLLGLVIGISACKVRDTKSNVKYDTQTYGELDALGLQFYLERPAIDVCVKWTGSTPVSSSKIEIFVRRAIMMWVDALRPVSTSPLSSQVRFLDKSSDCDSAVMLVTNQNFPKELTSAYAVVTWPFGGRWPVLNINPNKGEVLEQGIVNHEIGHCFGLFDTYAVVRKLGDADCKDGQVQSVMCNASGTSLSCDDIVGVRKHFKKIYADKYDHTYKGFCLDFEGTGRVDWRASRFHYGFLIDSTYSKSGLLIQSVTPGSPADMSGLRAGDVITSMDGKQMATESDMRLMVLKSTTGSFKCRVLRNERTIPITLVGKARGAAENTFGLLGGTSAGVFSASLPALDQSTAHPCLFSGATY